MFNAVDSKISFPEQEKKILAYWDENEIFELSLKQNIGNEEFVFYDGPPFATGLPHYGHLLAGTIKDVVPRYQTMRGKYVDRVFGWDCHGLPVENEMERELGITSKHEIEEYGVHKFNEDCRSIVLRYTSEWEKVVKRIGRWVDFRNGYRTMDSTYMESIWWVFKQLWTNGLIYEGYKILPYCPRCATPLSNFEANQGYKDVDDPSVTVRFRLSDEPDSYILAWTTTPWTLPSNLALAVGEDINYVKVADEEGATYILAEDRLSAYYKDESPEIIRVYKGKELCGLNYSPLFPYFAELAESGAFKVVSAGFVSTTDGTGIVHIAPGFGEDDAQVGKEHGLPSVCPIDAECRFAAEIHDFEGKFVKDCDSDIIKKLKHDSKLVHRATYHHSYPHCWRCDSPLIYRSISTWFVNVEKIKDRLLAANEQIRWVPEHIKHGRFGKWLENAHDWAISRNRYWGCPIPIWKNEDTEEIVCIGSIAELEEKSGEAVDDIHKHFVDDIEIASATPGKKLTRVTEVLDCWFESGAMPYAQRHYPFENKEWLEKNFPADFIAEGLDQTRGWFYTLIVLGGALFDKPAFKNVIVNGLVLAEDGRKMSKRLKNYPDPEYVMEAYGADALRLCLLSSPVLRGEDLRFSETTVKETIRSVMLPLWNAYSFLVTYARVDEWTPELTLDELHRTVDNPLDLWIISRLNNLIGSVRDSMDNYDLQAAATGLVSFLENLTNWYIRRSRRRFWKSQNDSDKNEAYHTLYHILVRLCQTSAPFIPFITETIYQNLKTPEMPVSVHLTSFPEDDDRFNNSDLDRKMNRTIHAVSLGRSLRSQAGTRTRQPLNCAFLVSINGDVRDDLNEMKEIIAEELNVKNVVIDENEEKLVHLSAKANFKNLGPRLGKSMKNAAAVIADLDYSAINKLRAGERLSIAISDDSTIEITLDDIELRREEKPGIGVANYQDITVALDMMITEDLEFEGWAREIVNRLQNLRKEADLEVSDRIRIGYRVPAPLDRVIDRFKDYIMGETLGTEITQMGADTEGILIAIDDHDCYFSVDKITLA